MFKMHISRSAVKNFISKGIKHDPRQYTTGSLQNYSINPKNKFTLKTKNMTRKTAQKRLEKAGYTITYCMNGAVIATKNQSIYPAKSINALFNKLLKPKY